MNTSSTPLWFGWMTIWETYDYSTGACVPALWGWALLRTPVPTVVNDPHAPPFLQLYAIVPFTGKRFSILWSFRVFSIFLSPNLHPFSFRSLQWSVSEFLPIWGTCNYSTCRSLRSGSFGSERLCVPPPPPCKRLFMKLWATMHHHFYYVIRYLVFTVKRFSIWSLSILNFSSANSLKSSSSSSSMKFFRISSDSIFSRNDLFRIKNKAKMWKT